MSLREQLKKAKRSMRGRRWTIREVDNVLTEVKMIFNPHEYENYSSSRKMYTDRQLLKILEKNYERSINNSMHYH